MPIESHKLPLELMDEFAERESYRRDVYRPAYSLHKWWARRPGSTFRILGLATLTDDDVTKEDILRASTSGDKYDGYYLNPPDQDEFSDVTVLDPFTGGGCTHVELNRLGANTIGYELNPVAWWITKKTIENIDLDDLNDAYEDLVEETRDELSEYFTTTDPKTGDECEVLYAINAQVLPCQRCDEEVTLMPRYTLQKSRARRPAVVYCPNPDCDDPLVTIDEKNDDDHYRDLQDTETCGNCGTTFDPTDGNSSNAKYTCSNGHKHNIKETMNRRDEKPSFRVIAIQYTDPTGTKKFKLPDGDDHDRLQSARDEFAEKEDELPIPTQSIPPGDKRTPYLLKYNYESYDELWTDRQKLVFGTLMQKAKQVEDRRVRELLITSVSSCLNRNSKLCKWDYDYAYATDVFERKSYIPRSQFAEGNPLNTDENIVSFTKAYERVYDAKAWTEAPFEKVKEGGDVVKYPIQQEHVDEDRLKGLYCQTSERIDLDDESVDYVITDPPYFDNVQYSELSEYFYVWLREGLKDDYDEFQPKHVPSTREIVANSSAGKSEDFFIEALSNVFSECHRVLKDDGEMVFTYHHNSSEAWQVILSALINSGFTVTGAYPVQSEMPNNPVISDLDNTEYDIVISCNKESADEETTLNELKQTLYFETQEWLQEERQMHRNLSAADLGVVLRGRCLYHYSKYYPNIYDDDEAVDVKTVLEAADDVIAQVLETTVDLPASIDTITRAYVGHLKRVANSEEEDDESETFDELRKQLMPQNLNVSDLEGERLVTGDRTAKRAVLPGERVDHIEDKLEREGDLLDIDKVHYLYHLFTTDQNTGEHLHKWKNGDTERLASKLAEITGDDTYENVMDMTLESF